MSPRPRGASGLGLAHLVGEERAVTALSQPRTGVPIGKAESRRRRERGKRAEREAVHLWRANGWPDARRQYGSGSMRGGGGEVILPGDIAGVMPWCPIEVKFNVASARPGRTWPGDAFARATIKRLLTEWRTKPAGATWYPVLMVRLGESGVKMPERWRFYVPSGMLLWLMEGTEVAKARTFKLIPEPMDEWVQLGAHEFFDQVARAVPAA